MCWLPVPNELTRTQSGSSGFAPHLESSERNDTLTVLLQRAVLLQIWKTQSCCSGVGPDLAYLEFSPRFFIIIESFSLSGLRSGAFLGFDEHCFFFLSSHQSGNFWNLITQSYVISRPSERLSSWIQSSIVCVYWHTQSRSSDVAPHVESTVRNDT